jgi:hypothetical protein
LPQRLPRQHQARLGYTLKTLAERSTVLQGGVEVRLEVRCGQQFSQHFHKARFISNMSLDQQRETEISYDGAGALPAIPRQPMHGHARQGVVPESVEGRVDVVIGPLIVGDRLD